MYVGVFSFRNTPTYLHDIKNGAIRMSLPVDMTREVSRYGYI
jgi:hypothetical protein